MPETDDHIHRLRSGDPDAQVGAALDLLQARSREGLPELIELTRSPDVAVRSTVARVLGVLGSRDRDPAGRALLALVGDADPLVRSEAIDALGVLRYRPAAEAVRGALADPEPLVRASAAETAGDLGDAAVISDLERALADDDEAVRAYAANSLGRLGTSELLERLEQIDLSEQAPRVEAELLAARYRLGAEADLPRLLELLAEASEEDADAMLNAVADLALRPPAASFDDSAAVREALERLGDRIPGLRPQVERIAASLGD
jgi:HEAT repeat protein